MRVTTIPVTKTFELDSVPEYEGIRGTITVRQAKEAETIEEAELFSEQTHVFDDAEIGRYQVKRRWNPHMLIRYRAYKLLCACNLEDEDGNPLFEFKTDKKGVGHVSTSQNDFFRTWGVLDPVIVDEIYRRILEVNPQWQLALEGE